VRSFYEQFCSQHKAQNYSLALAIMHKAKFELPDERDSLCLKGVQFTLRFSRGAVVRAGSNDADEHPRDRNSHNQRIELNSANQYGDENHTAACDGNSPSYDKFAAALNRGLEFFNLRLQSHDFATMIVPIHGGGDDKLA
jgi:hypothetical protein